MTEQGTGSRKWMLAGIAFVLVVMAGAAYWMQSSGTGRQVEEAQLQLDEGIAQFRQKQYEESLATLGAIPEDVLQHWRIHFYMGSSYIMLDDFESAAVELEKAAALNPAEVQVYYALGVAYFRLRKLDMSKAYFAKVLEVDPTHEDARGLMDIVANMEREQQEDGSQP